MGWRRKRRGAADAQETTPGSDTSDSAEPTAAPGPEGPRARGPWDSAELPVESEDPARADLGALSVPGRPEVEVRLQVDERSQQVQAVLLVAADGALELRPFAAARNEDLWAELRPQVATEVERRGGTVEEVDGPFGPALRLVVPVVDRQGQKRSQTSTVFGIAGPRWLLRVTAFGRPAVEYDEDGLLEQTLRGVVVHRGSDPRAPGEPLPLHLPAGARRVGPQDASG